MMKRIFFYVPLLAALTCAGGCFDCFHELFYGGRPPPDTAIAPPAHPMPGDYLPADAVAFMADSLIFKLSALSENGIPSVRLADPGDALAQGVYSNLLRADVIRVPRGGTAYISYLLFSRRTEDGMWNITLETPDRRTVAFNQTLKLRKEVQP